MLSDVAQVIMEFMGGGCLTEILEQFEYVQLDESQIAYVCKEVRSRSRFIFFFPSFFFFFFFCFFLLLTCRWLAAFTSSLTQSRL
jgi:hypothetical protein